MRHLPLMFLLFALPCFASMPMPDVPKPEPELSTACMRAYCDCNAFSLAQVPELGPASQACECGHSPAMHAHELAPTFSGSTTHASGSSAFTIERDMSIKNVTAKLRCNMKKTHEVQANDVGQYVNQHITLNAVYSPDPADPNYSYSKATPSADLSMYVTNPVAAEFFEQGAEYLVTFERVQRPKPTNEPATS